MLLEKLSTLTFEKSQTFEHKSKHTFLLWKHFSWKNIFSYTFSSRFSLFFCFDCVLNNLVGIFLFRRIFLFKYIQFCFCGYGIDINKVKLCSRKPSRRKSTPTMVSDKSRSFYYKLWRLEFEISRWHIFKTFISKFVFLVKICKLFISSDGKSQKTILFTLEKNVFLKTPRQNLFEVFCSSFSFETGTGKEKYTQRSKECKQIFFNICIPFTSIMWVCSVVWPSVVITGWLYATAANLICLYTYVFGSHFLSGLSMRCWSLFIANFKIINHLRMEIYWRDASQSYAAHSDVISCYKPSGKFVQ